MRRARPRRGARTPPHAAWAEARRRGLDVRLVEAALDVDASDAAAWEAEYQASSGTR